MIDPKKERTVKNRNPSDHLANERTFLAWIRTCIAIMAFGFVVEKFSIFIKKITSFISGSPLREVSNIGGSTEYGYSSIFGIFLVALGGLMCILAFFKYKTTEKQIDQGSYGSSLILDVMLTLIIVLVGLFLVVYLVHNVI